ncbi:MAG: thymidine phosphorylase, partial [Bdellovibrionales bacterium]
VGDKTSLILSPLVAAAGVPVPMMAGRGLGHTGGTLDKLEAIPGFNVRLDLDQFRRLIDQVGTAIIGQTQNICPADLKLYSLRDVTGTVDSIPLICASIMSKKLAEGVGGLVLDVKYGSGAFMKDLEQARTLARNLVQIGHLRGRRMVALLTDMNQPMGRFAGNACEVQECLDILGGQDQEHRELHHDTREVTLQLASHMLVLADVQKDLLSARQECERLLTSGAALQKFNQMCLAQGAQPNWRLPVAKYQKIIAAPAAGFVNGYQVESIGFAGIELGAGRLQSKDVIDPTAGIEFYKKLGMRTENGQPLFRIFANSEKGFQAAETRLLQAVTIDATPKSAPPLVAAIVTPNGGQDVHG